MRIGPVAIPVRAFQRIFQREVMLFAGGASFFALLGLFPAFAVLASVYGLIHDEAGAYEQVSEMAQLLPDDVGRFLMNQLSLLATTSSTALTLQGAIALVIALFAASRGAKAVITGLNAIAGREGLRSLVRYNLVALMAVLVGIGLLIAANLTVIFVPALLHPALDALGLDGRDVDTVINPVTLSLGGMFLVLALLYRYVMQRTGETSWAACLIGAGTSTLLWLTLSAGFTSYVTAFVNASIYGSLGAVIVFLIWIYWAAYVLFFGGAIAVETDKHYFRQNDQ
ncbi:YihY/virulence factor BrkB family protein [Alkalicaulis satelles]|uniref:YihY/virulence factor BrkB family protein n=2 Tax=Alkalicaulis satelles TaxID=2609175 RepID=A0A5M6ZKX7_9PROT|nr:YihY/virulence factor BrkB family protein [Alkalicaulis satelles]